MKEIDDAVKEVINDVVVERGVVVGGELPKPFMPYL